MGLAEPGWSTIHLSQALCFYSPNPWKNGINAKLFSDSHAVPELVIGEWGVARPRDQPPGSCQGFRPRSPGCEPVSALPRQLCDLRLPPPLSEPQSPAPLWTGGRVTGRDGGCRGGAGGREVVSNEYGVSIWADEKVLEMDLGDGCTHVWTSRQSCILKMA